jgi:hypothetical protein
MYRPFTLVAVIQNMTSRTMILLHFLLTLPITPKSIRLLSITSTWTFPNWMSTELFLNLLILGATHSRDGNAQDTRSKKVGTVSDMYLLTSMMLPKCSMPLTFWRRSWIEKVANTLAKSLFIFHSVYTLTLTMETTLLPHCYADLPIDTIRIILRFLDSP